MTAFRRWTLFVLLTGAGVLGLIDRQIIAVLKPAMAAELHWSDDAYATLGATFQAATAVALLGAGPLADRLGVRWANAIGIFTWSLAALAHGASRTMLQFTLCRVALGATEAIGTPAGIKTVASIFPPEMRSTGIGLSNAAASVAGICAPLLIPLLALPFGWRGAFVAAGGVGLVWAGLWTLATRGAPFPHAPADTPSIAADRRSVLAERSTWAIAGAKTLSDTTWWLMLFWAPDFLHRQFAVSGVAAGAPLALIYAGAAVGSLVSGAVATRLIVGGAPVGRVRKAMMLAGALLVLPLPLAIGAPGVWAAAGVLALTLAAHQTFSTSLFSLITDVAPEPKIGRVVGTAVFCGNLGGIVVTKAAGAVLTAGLGYLPLFLFAPASYFMALAWLQLMLPRVRSTDAASGMG